MVPSATESCGLSSNRRMISSPYNWPDHSDARAAISRAPLRSCCSQRSADWLLSNSVVSVLSFIALYLVIQCILQGDVCQEQIICATPGVGASVKERPFRTHQASEKNRA